jgi:hypothetical protein
VARRRAIKGELPIPRKRPYRPDSPDANGSSERRRDPHSTAPDQERAYLVAVETRESAGMSTEESMRELARLVRTAGGTVVGSAIQRRPRPDPATYVGSGKLDEVKAERPSSHYTMVVFDDPLSPSQQLNLEKTLEVKVLDRSALILDIFARRARGRRRSRSSSRSTSTCCRVCAASGSTSSAWRARSAPAVPVRRSSKPTAG